MFIVGHLLKSIAGLLHIFLQLSILLFIVRAVLSWIQGDPRQPIISFIYRVTDPILERVHRFIPTIGMVDLSPVVVILCLWFLDNFLVPSLHDTALKMLP